MKAKKYSSYTEIDSHLEILKLEREIHLQKTILNFEKLKGSLSPIRMIHNVLGTFKSNLSDSFVRILLKTAPIILMWFIKRKRGN
jgi:hypothetical protein